MTSTETDADVDEALTAVLAASRSLVAISAQSLASVEETVDIVQFRILVVIASRGACALSEVAEAVGLHVSTASRTCDRMVAGGLLNRSANETDRRNIELTLTPTGEALVGRVLRRRRSALQPVVERLTPRKRRRLAAAMRDFAAAAGEPSDRALWAMGWTTDEPEPEEDA
jgi:DNA-binding MarR family transcriptional regulator